LSHESEPGHVALGIATNRVGNDRV